MIPFPCPKGRGGMGGRREGFPVRRGSVWRKDKADLVRMSLEKESGWLRKSGNIAQEKSEEEIDGWKHSQ
jgi:hypothetical protein